MPEPPVGRDAEAAAVELFLDGLEAGAAACLLEGEAGIGKTTVWGYGLDAAEARGYRIHACRPVEAESQFSYSGLGDLLAGTSEAVLDVLPAPQRRALEVALLLAEPEGDAPTGRAVGAAVLGVLQELGREGPVVVAVDDVQWLDGPSASVLSFAARRLRDERVGLLLTERTAGARSGPLGLERSFLADRLKRVELGPVSLGAVRALVQEHLGARLSRPLLRRLHEVSGGNPFVALELARGLPQSASSADAIRVPASLRELVHERLRRLPEDELEALRAAAALSQPSRAVLERALRREVSLGAALAAGVVELDGERIRFNHPLLASALSSESSADERRALHLQLAAVIEEPEEAARHLALGAAGPDSEAAAVLERAAAAARARGAPDSATELGEQAIRMTPADERENAQRRRLATAGYHFDAGNSGRAAELLTEAVALAAPGRERAEALLRLGIVNSDVDRFEEAARLVEEALEESPDELLKAEAHLNLAWIKTDFAMPEGASDHADASVGLAEQAGDRSLLAQALAAAALVQARRGGTLDAAVLERALALEAEVGDGIPLERRPSYVQALQLVYSAEFDEARPILERLVQRARETADAAITGPLQALASAEDFAGRLEVARRHSAEAVETAQEAGRSVRSGSGLTMLSWIEAKLGRVEEARQHAEQALAFAERSPPSLLGVFARTVLGFLELSLDDPEAARGWLDPTIALLDDLGIDGPIYDYTKPIHIEVVAALGEHELALSLTERLRHSAEQTTDHWGFALGITERSFGIVLAASGDLPGALEALERALAQDGLVRMPFERARTLLELGRVQRRLKQRRAARETLSSALAIFEQLPAPLWAEKARAELGRIGGRAASRDDLTPAERRIAALVVEGKTNKEVAAELVLTVHTVEAALTGIYRKLGVHSRNALTAKLAAR